MNHDIVVKVALELDTHDIISLSLVCKKYNKLICQSDLFWIKKLKHDFDIDFKKKCDKDHPKIWYLCIGENINIHNLAVKYDQVGLMDIFFKVCNPPYIPSLLRKALEYNSNNMIKYIMDNDLLIDRYDQGVEISGTYGHIELFNYFVEKGGRHYFSAYLNAAKMGHLHMVDYILEKYEDYFREYFGSYLDRGMIAAASGEHLKFDKNNFEMVKYFESKGAKDYSSALYSATVGGREELVIYFLEKGATYNDKYLEHAKDWGFEDIYGEYPDQYEKHKII